MGARIGTPPSAKGGKWSGQARGGESKAKALAGDGRGAVRAQRGGPRRPGAERDACEGTSRIARARRTRAAGRVTKTARWPEGQPHATRAVGAAFAAVAASGGRAERATRPDTTGGTQASGGGQALSGDAAGRGQAKDERGSSPLAHRAKYWV